jgi:F-type H+-transporting ATPase subunit b
MLIDWFTVAAQALNFLILVWLLRRYAYRPILEAIQAREQRIAAQVAAAAAAQAEAVSQRDTFRHQNEALEQQRATLLAQVTAEAQSTRTRLLEQARVDADSRHAQLLDGLTAESAALSLELKGKVREEVLAITAQALRDLAHVSLNEAVVGVFLERLAALPEADRRLFATSGAAPAMVRSACDLTPATRDRIQAAVAAVLGSGIRLEFATAAELSCGIELQSAGHKLAWSIEDYLANLTAGIDQVIAAHRGAT